MYKKIITILILLLMSASLASARDLRAIKLKRFLERYPWTPLLGYEHEILYCADKFNLDYRLYVAIAGAESSYGKRYPKSAKNLTGYAVYGNNVGQFESIYQNIYKTHELIATAKWYKKYRETGDIWDLIHVYKGVPPYDHYYRNMRYALDQIQAISIEKERAEDQSIVKRSWEWFIYGWLTTPFHEFVIRERNELDQKIASSY